MTKRAQAVVFEAVNRISVREVALPECGETQILCETLYTFVSPGTELRVLGGDYSKPEDFPLVPGYSAIARVVEVGARAKGFRVGDLVTGRNPVGLPEVNSMWGGQCGMHVYNTDNEDTPVLLPENADPLEYVTAEVAAISLRGVDAADPLPGETAIVIGQGLIGAFSAAFLIDAGCRVIVCDVDAGRLEAAKKRGAAFAVNLTDADAMERLKFLTCGGADIVVEASGTSAGAMTAYQLLRRKPQNYSKEYKVEPIKFYHSDWPRLVMQANYLEEVSINPYSFFNGEGVVILTPGDRGIEERQKVVELIRTGRLETAEFLDRQMPVAEAAQAYPALLNREFFSVVFNWK